MKQYKRLWKVDLFIYADTITDAKEVANHIDNYMEDNVYASVDSRELKFQGRVKIQG